MAQSWFVLSQIPDLTLNKYSSLASGGVDGVLKRHSAFLRQLNRKGVVSGVSIHLFYLYLHPDDTTSDTPGHRLHIYIMFSGEEKALENVSAIMKASPLSDYYHLEETDRPGEIGQAYFSSSAFLTKSETFLTSQDADTQDYYMINDWTVNDEGRLIDMCNMMDALGHTSLYRVDLYPVEKNNAIRKNLDRPMKNLRKKQDTFEPGVARDYAASDVLKNYEGLIEKYDSSPHFIANIMTFADSREDVTALIDAAGAESLKKGKYTISAFGGQFEPMSFLDGETEDRENIREQDRKSVV